jgi:hypothetical protein
MTIDFRPKKPKHGGISDKEDQRGNSMGVEWGVSGDDSLFEVLLPGFVSLVTTCSSNSIMSWRVELAFASVQVGS